MNHLYLIQLNMSDTYVKLAELYSQEDDLLNHAVDTIAETQKVSSPNTFSTQIIQKLQIKSFTKRRIADAASNNNNNNYYYHIK